MKVVLVTGATGYIGQPLMSALSLDPSVGEIRIVTRDRRRFTEPAGTAAIIRVCEGDIRYGSFARDCASGITHVFHLAAMTPPIPSGVSDEEIDAANVRATVILAEEAGKAGARRFVHFSTTGIYGHSRVPSLDEDSPCNPPNSFEMSKLKAEQALLSDAPAFRMGIVILRPSNVIGGGQPRQRLLPLMRAVKGGRVILTRPPGRQNLVYLDDVVDAALRLGLSDAPSALPALYNVNCPISNDELVSELARIIGVPDRFPRMPIGFMRTAGRVAGAVSPPLPRVFSSISAKIAQLVDERVIDSSRLCSALPGWPPVGLGEGLRRAAECYRKHGLL